MFRSRSRSACAQRIGEVWDFTLKGADQKTVDAFRKDVTKDPPRQGGTLVHNDQVEVKAQTPDFKGADAFTSCSGSC
jgi:hypothetical protein